MLVSFVKIFCRLQKAVIALIVSVTYASLNLALAARRGIMFEEIKTPAQNQSSRDGFERIWGEGVPDISDAVREMLVEWKDAEEYEKIMLFFLGHCDYSQERAEYLLRELLRGTI